MKNLFSVGVVVVVALAALGGYWYLNPHHAPTFLRTILPQVEMRGPQSPMTNFRPPQF